MAQCANCGAQVPDDAAHCVQCGNEMVAEAAGPTKKTMVGLTGVDQKELQRAIEAARAATASGEAPKKAARRTMMGVAAISMQQIQKAATAKQEAALDDDWGAPPSAVISAKSAKAPSPAAPDVDDDWGPAEPSGPAIPLVKSLSAPPTQPSTPAAKSTVMMSSMADVPPPSEGRATAVLSSMPEPKRDTEPTGPPPAARTRPVTGPRVTLGFEAMPPPARSGPATREPAAPPVGAAKATVAFSAMAPPPGAPATSTSSPAPRPTTGSRRAPEPPVPTRPTTGSRGAVEASGPATGSRTVAFSAMAAVPGAPATQTPGRPTTGSRSAPAAVPDIADADTPVPDSIDVELADTISGGRELSEQLAAARRAPSSDIDPIAPSSPDPLADTISPGSMRIDQILRDVEAAAAAPAPIPASLSSTAPTPTPISVMPGTPAAVPATPTTSSTALKKSGTITRPPFLASKALAEDIHPTEPGRSEMRAGTIAGGVLLVALWAMPVSFSPLAFAWQAVGLEGAAKVLAFYTPVAGALLLLLGILPAPYRVRALGALVLGMVPVIAAVGGLGPLEPTRGWPGALLAVGMILLPGALIHRANYRASVLARVLVALGLLLMLAWMFVPRGSGFLPALVGGFSSTRGMVQSVVSIAALILVAASLLAFMPSATTGGSGKTGRLLVLVRPALAGAAAVAGGASRDTLVPLAVSLGVLFVFGALASLGTAQTLASIERPAGR